MSLGVYWEEQNTEDWHDIEKWTEARITFSADENQLSDFTLEIDKPENSSDELIYPKSGDRIVVTEDKTRYKVLNDSLAGVIIDSKKTLKGWDCNLKKWIVTFNITVEQQNTSTEEVIINTKTETPLTTILDEILLDNTSGLLGGLINGISYPKFRLFAADINVPSADSQGSATDVLTDILKSINYKWKAVYFCTPDGTGVKIVQQYFIYDSGGLPVGKDSAWTSGITDSSLRLYHVANPNYSEAFNENDEPQYLWTEKKLEHRDHTRGLVNHIKLFGVQEDSDGALTRFEETQSGQRKSIFDLKQKVRDIKFAARKVTTKIDSVTNSTTIDIPQDAAEKILYHQLRLDSDYVGDLYAQITTGSGISNPIKVTVSGNTITLGTALPGMAIDNLFELVGSGHLLDENRDENDYPVYYATKHAKPDENGSIAFAKYDIPNPAEKIIALFIALSEFAKKQIWRNSINKFGLKIERQEFDFPLTAGQIKQLFDVYQKLSEPIEEITCLSIRPEPLQVGWIIPVNLTDITNRNFIVQSVKSTYISKNGQKGRPLIEQSIKFTTVRDDLKDLLLSLKNKNLMNQAVLQNKEEDRAYNTVGLQFSWESTETQLLPKIFFNATLGGFTEIAMINEDTTGFTQITDFDSNTQLPTLHPLGSQLFYLSAKDTGSNLQPYVSDIDSNGVLTNEVRLLTDAFNYERISVRPDGNAILIQTNEGSGGTSIKKANYNPATKALSSISFIINNSNINWLGANAFSPDGLNFTYAEGTGSATALIYKADYATGTPTLFTASIATDLIPAWSPLNDYIGFGGIGDAGTDRDIILVLANNTGGRTDLTKTGSDEVQCAWKPDGLRLAFEANSSGGVGLELRAIDKSGSNNDLIYSGTGIFGVFWGGIAA